MSNIPQSAPRAVTATPVEPPLSILEHNDTDKHFIGESLPVPSLVEVNGTGITNSVGTSKFPARVDHTHGSQMIFSQYNSSNQTIAAGNVYVNTLNRLAGRDLGSGQVLTFPERGLYLIQAIIGITRVTAGNFAGQVNILFAYNNAGTVRNVTRQLTAGLPNTNNINVTDFWLITAQPGAGDNFQMSIQHNDTSSWTVALTQLIIARLCSNFTL